MLRTNVCWLLLFAHIRAMFHLPTVYANHDSQDHVTDAHAANNAFRHFFRTRTNLEAGVSSERRRLLVQCDAGKYCPENINCGTAATSDCEKCPKGRFSETHENRCTMCPGGYVALFVGRSSCTACAAGYYSTSTRELCQSCPDGWWSADLAVQCEVCSAGYAGTGDTQNNLGYCRSLANIVEVDLLQTKQV